MNIPRIILSAAFAFSLLASALADTHYVAQAGQTPVEPYTNDWPSAASNIQEAVNQASAGDTVLVSTGVYASGVTMNGTYGNIRVYVNKAVALRSANNDPANTIIRGDWVPITNDCVRCVYMAAGASLIGFTLTNGISNRVANDGQGGGIYCADNSVIVSNCVIAGNGTYCNAGGGACRGTFYDCAFVGNNATRYYGGGAACYAKLVRCGLYGNLTAGYGAATRDCVLEQCTLAGNTSFYGASAAWLGTLTDCVLSNNSALTFFGGAVFQAVASNCIIVGNTCPQENGGGARESTLYNCLIMGNECSGKGAGAYLCTLYNSTVVGNRTKSVGGGVYGGVAFNSIVYSNAADSGGANWASDSTTAFTNSCTAPAVAGWAVNNTANNPMFVAWGSGYGTNHVAGDYQLLKGSPCIDTGTNQAWMTNAYDLKGRLRVRYVWVDMGCYEFLYKGAVLSVR